MLEEITEQLAKDLEHRGIKAWRIRNGEIDNPYPISQNYVWFLTKPKYRDRVGLASLCRMKYHFEEQERKAKLMKVGDKVRVIATGEVAKIEFMKDGYYHLFMLGTFCVGEIEPHRPELDQMI